MTNIGSGHAATALSQMLGRPGVLAGAWDHGEGRRFGFTEMPQSSTGTI
ncbi:MAG: chemotaxis protein CheC, partial [Gaiellales bacterium]